MWVRVPNPCQIMGMGGDLVYPLHILRLHLLGIDMPNRQCRAPTDRQDLKMRRLPVNPSLLKGWGHKVPAASFIYIEVITIYL